MEKTNSRNLIWDVIRGIGALLVLFHHYTRRYDTLFGHIDTWPVQSAFNLGSWGVCIFFVLTGLFLIPSIYSSRTIGVYYKKRIIRLYPSYIPCVLITWIIMSCVSSIGDRNVGFFQMLGNLTMFQGFLGIPHVDGAYWTLAVQIIVYIIIGALFFIVKKDVGKLLNVLFVWLLIGIMVSVLNNYCGFTKLTFITDSKYIHLFIQGIILYCIGEKQGKPNLLYLFMGICLCYDLFWFPISYLVFNTLIIVLMLIVVVKNIELEKKGFFVFIGTISFPLYLLHQNIGYIVIRSLEQVGLTNEIWIIIPMTISVFLAYVVYSFMEKPLSNMLKRILIK